jgi:hypothetical protein
MYSLITFLDSSAHLCLVGSIFMIDGKMQDEGRSDTVLSSSAIYTKRPCSIGNVWQDFRSEIGPRQERRLHKHFGEWHRSVPQQYKSKHDNLGGSRPE